MRQISGPTGRVDHPEIIMRPSAHVLTSRMHGYSRVFVRRNFDVEPATRYPLSEREEPFNGRLL
jgi:hypothetical protein